MTEAINSSYERIQQEAKGAGVKEWRQADKLRADLSGTYQSLKDDERYALEYKSSEAWKRYEETKTKVEQLAPQAREKMLRSAQSLERLSIPTPEGEGVVTKDTNKLLLTAHERGRLEGLVNRAQQSGRGPFKANPVDVLKPAYEQGLEQGGPGAALRCVLSTSLLGTGVWTSTPLWTAIARTVIAMRLTTHRLLACGRS